MTANTMREGKLWALLRDNIHDAYKKLSTTGTSNEYHAMLDSIASKVADDVDARFLQAAQSEPEEKLDFEKLESLGWQIAVCAMCGTHASAIKPVQSVPVVGEPVARLLEWHGPRHHDIPHGGIAARTYQEFPKDEGSNGGYWHECGRELFEKPTTSIPAAELATLREKAARLEHELETERMRLAACGVIALSNTADSAINARDMLPEYWSASAQDCASAVDREMDYRSRLAVTEQERDELRKKLAAYDRLNKELDAAIAQEGE